MSNKRPRAIPHTNRVFSWVHMGMYFGYPPCCIGEFVIHIVKNTAQTRGVRQFHGTGYVPCIKCNLLPANELLATIAHYRQCEEPFNPNVESDQAVA